MSIGSATFLVSVSLLAQAAEPTTPGWLNTGLGLGTGAILVWYLWYTTAVVQPRQQQHVENIVKENREQQKEARQDFRDCLNDTCKEITEGFRDELRQLPCKERKLP